MEKNDGQGFCFCFCRFYYPPWKTHALLRHPVGFTLFFFKEGLGGWDVYCVDGRTDGRNIRGGKLQNGHRNLLSHNKTRLSVGHMLGCNVFLERLLNAQLLHLKHLQMNLPGSIWNFFQMWATPFLVQNKSLKFIRILEIPFSACPERHGSRPA